MSTLLSIHRVKHIRAIRTDYTGANSFRTFKFIAETVSGEKLETCMFMDDPHAVFPTLEYETTDPEGCPVLWAPAEYADALQAAEAEVLELKQQVEALSIAYDKLRDEE